MKVTFRVDFIKLFNFIQVQTKDGYLVALQRLSSRNKDLGGQRGPPVLLQHGLFMVNLLFILLMFPLH
jgi:hypothetical protein